jgi:excisionase family DNA binding protein
MHDHLTTQETAELTRVPAATLRWMRSRGLGPKSWKLGSRVFYRRTDVEAWLERAYATAVGE